MTIIVLRYNIAWNYILVMVQIQIAVAVLRKFLYQIMWKQMRTLPTSSSNRWL